jgi:hypothetical protein
LLSVDKYFPPLHYEHFKLPEVSLKQAKQSDRVELQKTQTPATCKYNPLMHEKQKEEVPSQVVQLLVQKLQVKSDERKYPGKQDVQFVEFTQALQLEGQRIHWLIDSLK